MNQLVGRLLAMAATLLCGCAVLPERPALPDSQAIARGCASPLVRTVEAALGDDPRSGFRLLEAPFASFRTRAEIVAEARCSLDVQYYLFANDRSGRYLMRLVAEAARRGVRVRLLLDDLTTSGEDELLDALASLPNVEVRLFNPFPAGRGSLATRIGFSLLDFERINHRMHNKVLIADNEAAVTGGRNIGDEYFMNSSTSNFVDVDVFATGPVVPDLSDMFDRYWNSREAFPLDSIVRHFGSREDRQHRLHDLIGEAESPAPSDRLEDTASVRLVDELQAGHIDKLIRAAAEVVVDGPFKAERGARNELAGTATQRVVSMVRTARHSMTAVSPYFVPGDAGMQEILELIAQGVEVTVYTNSLGSTDDPLAQAGYVRYRNDLLEAGVIIKEMRSRPGSGGPFDSSKAALHAKLVVVDGHYLYVGSLNLDQRSAYKNTELGLIIDSQELVQAIKAEMGKDFLYDLRLGDRGQVQWVVKLQDGGQQVYNADPEAGPLRMLQLRVWRLLAPMIPETDL